ncbi:LAETG motif-containing sortase-dependent surface protein [Streptomyces canus]|uniref:LAETG motif-containing sortase-dependent surface protein n=1 Tax=Streptomyces canus TaxID=58343 RepID=UPI003F53F683
MRILGVASASAMVVLGLASSALACSISDFKAEAKCDREEGIIVVTDTDASGADAAITVLLKGENGVETQVGQQHVSGSATGTPVTFWEDWKPNTTYRIRVVVDKANLNKDIQPALMTPSDACEAPSPPLTPSVTPTPRPVPSRAVASASPTPSHSGQGMSTPSVAPSSVPPNLAETGANSNTVFITGVASALLLAGGAAIGFAVRRQDLARMVETERRHPRDEDRVRGAQEADSYVQTAREQSRTAAEDELERLRVCGLITEAEFERRIKRLRSSDI